jgi:hypothetical protein
MNITKVMRDKKLFEKYSIAELLRELAKLKFTFLNNQEHIISEISNNQSIIFKAFDIKFP